MQTLFLKAENSFLPGKFSLVNSCSSLVMTMVFIGSCEDLASGKINCLQLQFIHSGSKRGRIPITKFISWWVTLVFLLFPKTVDSYRPLQCAASRVFIAVWLQTAELRFQPGSHGHVHEGFPLSQECNVTHTHTLTSYLNTPRLWTHLFIDNLRSAATRAGTLAKICIHVRDKVSP